MEIVWKENITLLTRWNKQFVYKPRVAILSFNGTVALTNSGKQVPDNKLDTLIPDYILDMIQTLNADGYAIVIIDNEYNIKTGHLSREDVKYRVEQFAEKLAKKRIPIFVMLSIVDNGLRKPYIDTWKILNSIYAQNDQEIEKQYSIVIGNAAGRIADKKAKKKADKSCVDRMFALNIGVRFSPVDEFINPGPSRAWAFPKDMITIDEKKLLLSMSEKNMLEKSSDLSFSDEKQLAIIIIGQRSSGRTTLANQIMDKDKDKYIYVEYKKVMNRKQINKHREKVHEGKSFIFDDQKYFLLTVEARAVIIDYFKEFNIPVVLINLTTPLKVCKFLNKLKVYGNHEHQPYEQRTYLKYRSLYQIPVSTSKCTVIDYPLIINESKGFWLLL
jgi:bifunctional polynucleotide phosphatase/kinase